MIAEDLRRRTVTAGLLIAVILACGTLAASTSSGWLALLGLVFLVNAASCWEFAAVCSRGNWRLRLP